MYPGDGRELVVEAKRIADLLERIATALETANYQRSFPPQAAPASPASGYQCPTCYAWVPYGQLHQCNTFRRVTGTSGSYTQCNAAGKGGHCYLAEGHGGDHQFAIVTNG